MARLSELPPEMIRHIGSFLCPDWSGEMVLDHADLGWDWVWDIYDAHKANRESLFNFAFTSKGYYQLLVPELMRSVGVISRSGDTEVRQLFKLLRLLFHNPAASCGAVRKLFIFLHSEDHPGEPFDLSNPTHQREVQLLEEVAGRVGIDIWKKTFSWNSFEAGHIIGSILTTKADFLPHFLKGFVIGILILHLSNIRDLTILLPSTSLKAMVNVLRRAQRSIANSNKQLPLLHLQHFAITHTREYKGQLPDGFQTLFSFRPDSTAYLRDCQLRAPLAWSTNITSLALREIRYITPSTLEQLIMNCERLTRFVYAHDVWVCPEFPSPGTILQTLKKHASSLKVLCLNFVWIDEQANELPPPYIDSFKEFTCLGALWISCACFGEDSQSSVLRRIPPSLYILHLAGDASVVADDLEWWANILTGKSLGGEDTSSGGGSVSSDDESEPVYPQEEDESDFCDQAQDGLEMEEDSLELVEDDTSEGDVDEDVETGDEETDDNSDDEEDEYDIDKYSMEEYKGDDYNEYDCDEHEFEEDGYGQDKNDLEKDEEEILCEEELCEGDDVTEDEYECRVGEYGEHEYNEDECEDKREDEPDEDEQQANQQEENHRDDKQDESLNDNLYSKR
ncbi:hypothetical protein K456DRAFT_1758804 [Colletotrichum gloeosporioides 23]|nr:hypothetical protein K456DRAFT_1758804 [Colletotrichum gloeosporioides 23]